MPLDTIPLEDTPRTVSGYPWSLAFILASATVSPLRGVKILSLPSFSARIAGLASSSILTAISLVIPRSNCLLAAFLSLIIVSNSFNSVYLISASTLFLGGLTHPPISGRGPLSFKYLIYIFSNALSV